MFSRFKSSQLRVTAPAKINLFLHILGKRDDGLHDLQSLATFADISDTIVIEPAKRFSFCIDGPMARRFEAKDCDASAQSGNLVVRAAYMLAEAVDKPLDCKITLTKNLPLGSGIGGGSSDAAACLWGLCQLWNIPLQSVAVQNIMRDLGSDVPVCMSCKTAIMSGDGSLLSPAPDLPEIPILLVYCGKPSDTASVYKNFGGMFSVEKDIPEKFSGIDHLINFLHSTSNDLFSSAVRLVPDIRESLQAIDQQDGALISRMSGSGSTCFGLFESVESCMVAAENIMLAHPDWWVRHGILGSPVRY